MPSSLLHRITAGLLVLCFCAFLLPTYALHPSEPEELPDRFYDTYADASNTLPTLLEPQNGYVRPGRITVRWQPDEAAARYQISVEDPSTEQSPDAVYYAAASLSEKTITLPLAVALQITVSALQTDADGQRIYRPIAVSDLTTAVVQNDRVWQGIPEQTSLSVNLAASGGTQLPIRWQSADPETVPLAFSDAAAPQIEQVLLQPVGDQPVSYAATLQDGIVRIVSEGAALNSRQKAELFVRLQGSDALLPIGIVTLRAVSKAPTVQIQSLTLDRFRPSAALPMQAVCPDGAILSLQIDPTQDADNPYPQAFFYDAKSGTLSLSPGAEQLLPTGKLKLRFAAQIEGYDAPILSTTQITLVDSMPTLRLSESSVLLYPNPHENTVPFTLQLLPENVGSLDALPIESVRVVPMEALTAAEQRTYALNSRFAATGSPDGHVTITALDDAPLVSGKLLLELQYAHTARTQRLPLRVAVRERVTLQAEQSSLTLAVTPYPQNEARSVRFTLPQQNLSTGALTVTDRSGSPVEGLVIEQQENLLLFTPTPALQAGTYRLLVYADGVAEPVALTLRVVDRMPQMQLSLSGRLDVSDPARTLTLTARLQHTDYTLSDALSVEVANEKLYVRVTDSHTLAVGAYGGLQKGERESVPITVTLPDGILLQDTLTVIPTRSTVVFSLTQDSVAALPGETLRLSVAENTRGYAVEWQSDDPAVASVADGVVTAHKPGVATITATAGGRYTDTVTVYVEDSLPIAQGMYRLRFGDVWLTASDALTVSATAPAAARLFRLTYCGEGSYTITARDGRTLYADASGVGLRWPRGTSAERFELTVHASCVSIRPVDLSDTLTVANGKVVLGTGTWQTEAVPMVTDIALGQSAYTLEVGEIASLQAKTTPAGLESQLQYRSSAPDVVAVNAAGRLTALSAGSSTVTVTDPESGVTVRCTVTVQSAVLAKPDGVYTIRLQGSDRVLTVSGGGSANGTTVTTAADSGKATQRFRLRTVGETVYLYPLSSNNGNAKVLDVYRSSSAGNPITAGCAVDIWSYGDTDAQAWLLQRDGRILLASNGTLALTAGADGAPVTVQNASGSAAQQWELLPAKETSSDTPLDWVNPLSVMATTLPFGSSFSNRPAYWGHLAWDGAGSATTVMAAADGVVQNILPTAASSGHGNIVLLRHTQNGKTFYSAYSHLANGSIAVSVGQRVTAGQTLGKMGATGNVTGRHLHFCIFSGGSRLPYSYCGASFSAPYRDYTANYRLRYYDPLRVIATDGALVTDNYYG